MSVLSTSAKGASFLILFQVASRGFTFLLNQILLRFLLPETLGLSAQLELFSITVLYFARESIRVACQRQAQGAQIVVNLAYLSIFFGILLAYGLSALYLRAETPRVPFFVESLQLFALGSVIELLSEPAFVVAQQKLLFKVRASAESISTIGRCISTCGVAFWANRNGFDPGVLPFAIGQMAYAGLLLVIYVSHILPIANRENFSLLLFTMKRSDEFYLKLFSIPLCKLSFSLFIQNSFKYVLTQGDGLLIASLASLADQGAYALASNYGGLIARILFQPIEETSRNIFAQLCSTIDEDKKSSNEPIEKARDLLQNILRLYGIIAMVACAIGPTAAPILLRIVAGSQWADTDASNVLVSYCYYIPLLAINGVTEAFVAATASESKLYLQSAMMSLWFAAFAGSTFFFMRVLETGAVGLIYANCLNMILRILFNFNFIFDEFKSRKTDFSISTSLPNTRSISSAIVTWAILQSPLLRNMPVSMSPKELLPIVGPIGVFTLTLVFFERQFLLQWIKPMLRQQAIING